MELDADEPGVIGQLDDLWQQAVRRHAGKPQPGGFECFLIADVDLVTVTMPLADPRLW